MSGRVRGGILPRVIAGFLQKGWPMLLARAILKNSSYLDLLFVVVLGVVLFLRPESGAL